MTNQIFSTLAVAATLGIILVPAPDANARQRRQSPAATAAPSVLAQSEKAFPTHTIWILKDFNGKPVASSDDLSLSIDETFRGSGYSGCNTWSATLYPVKGQRLAIGPLALTHNTCAPARVALERAYLTALHGGPAWDLTADELVIKGPRGTLRFRRSL